MREKPSIFISASAGEKTGMLRKILSDIGVHVSDAFDFAPGDSVSETAAQRISKADGVVAVYPDTSANIAFEMGVAAALKKPTFVLLDPVATLPSFAQSQLYLRTSLRDTETLRASLSRFVRDLKVKRHHKSRKLKPSDHTKGRRAITSFLSHIVQWRGASSPFEIERRVIEILKDTGVQVESKDSARDAGVDCVVWSERLQQTVGNPILIELKTGNVDAGRVAIAEKQLQRYLEAVGAQYGVLLYLDRAGKRFPDYQTKSAGILRFDLEDFVRKLQHHSFEEVLLSERNRVVHVGAE
jgi:hypothetical protein